MSGWAFFFMVIGVMTVSAWIMRLVDLIDG